MTLKLFVGTALSLIPISVQAQPEIDVAVKSGAGISDVTRDPQAEGVPHHRYGFAGGFAGYVHWPLVSRFFLGGQLDLLYAQRGTDAFFLGERIARNRYHYFDATLAIRPETRIGAARIYVLLGGGWSSLLKGSQLNTDTNKKRDITEFLRRYDVTLLVGAGVAISLPHPQLGPFRLNTIFLEVRHDRGLINTDVEDDANKNRSGSLTLGLSFALGSNAAAPSDPATTAATTGAR